VALEEEKVFYKSDAIKNSLVHIKYIYKFNNNSIIFFNYILMYFLF